MKNDLRILALPWVEFNKALMKLDSDNVIKDLIHAERNCARRTVFLLRLHQRFNKLRAQREKRELLNSI